MISRSLTRPHHNFGLPVFTEVQRLSWRHAQDAILLKRCHIAGRFPDEDVESFGEVSENIQILSLSETRELRVSANQSFNNNNKIP